MINNLLTNTVEIADGHKYCAIIGTSPSKGARSPLLWNHCYESYNSSIRMHPLDVEENNLVSLLDFLSNDPLFIGAAIAVPYKSAVYQYLNGSVDTKTSSIQAVNCLYRNNLTRSLYGTNTDGYGFVLSLKEIDEDLRSLNVGLIGSGGTARAIVPYLREELSPSGNLYTFSRTGFSVKLPYVNYLSLDEVSDVIPNLDVIINCTTVGSTSSPNKSLIPLNLLKKVNSRCIVCDVIYQPLKTQLLLDAESLGLRALNGLRMNLLQAALGFHLANSEFPLSDVSTLMQHI